MTIHVFWGSARPKISSTDMTSFSTHLMILYPQAWSLDMKRKLADIGPGGFFGDQSLLFGDQNQFTVQADTYCDVLVLSTEDFNAVLELYPDIKE